MAGAQTWIFQANPDDLDLDTYLAEETDIAWTVPVAAQECSGRGQPRRRLTATARPEGARKSRRPT